MNEKMNSDAKVMPSETETAKNFEITIEENDRDLKLDGRKDWRTAKDVV